MFFPFGGAQKVLQCLAFVKAYQQSFLPQIREKNPIEHFFGEVSGGHNYTELTAKDLVGSEHPAALGSWPRQVWSSVGRLVRMNMKVCEHMEIFGYIWTMWVSMFGIPCQVKLGQLGIGTSHATRALLTTFLPLGN